LGQIGPESEAPGRCPFCGARFARHYNAQLIESVENAEKASVYFINALEKVRSMETGFEIDESKLAEAVMKHIKAPS
jgi:hypothetical protein